MSEEMDFAQLVAQEDEINLLRKQVEKLEAELKTERMRLAACGVVALANTPESAAKARDMLPKYYSASCEDVAQAVDREMALRDRAEQLEAELECAKADYLNACVTIANMHRAAVGEVTGPKRGVVEDIEDLRLERDALLASKPLEAELSTWIQAVGLASTLKPNMVIDVSDPISMMQEIVEYVRTENKRLTKQSERRLIGLCKCGLKRDELLAENKRLREELNGGWVSFDVAQPEGLNLVQQYLGDPILYQQNAPFWAFPTSMWRGTKHPHATHWRYVHGPIAALEAEQKPMNIDELHEQGLVSRYDMISEANNYRG